MSSLGSRSAQEISELLDEYGIKHGPVVDSTRSLYEKKLREAMAKGKRAKSEASPDKTYYREEQEEVTYVYRTPVSISFPAASGGSYMSSRPRCAEREFENETSYSTYLRSRPEYRGRDFVDEHSMYDTPSTYRNSSLKSTPMKSGQDAPKAPKSSRLIPLWVQLVFFLAMVVFLYLVFSSMETNESIKGLE
ncbi:hypothetical protein F2P81_011685 [Scophthalmus maximus]|uniref:LEM domain-containing protein n=1 Tax=Scophthalmus maximus TaxID=52904 RepID=A0A6A4SQU6_SCOMX|nr:hypothetical protein F2P81_011685 [Scophthalmus maximus]